LIIRGIKSNASIRRLREADSNGFGSPVEPGTDSQTPMISFP
jgi:hypothetical protein